jgi:4-amino-4-deoxy-L-arabinose transferase-like glycosyltransferase
MLASSRSAERVFGAFTVAYGIIVLACLSLRPLWLDEVLQLTGTTASSVAALLRWIPYNIGASPLGYLVQRPLVLAAGPSPFWARLPAALFSVAGCAAMVGFCRTLDLPRRAWLFSLLIFAIVPSQFRYAIEGRPYSQALCLSVLSMVVLFKLFKAPGVSKFVIFILVNLAALYTQPYSALPGIGMTIWALCTRKQGDRRRVAVGAALCLIVSVALYLPWYRYSWPTWNAGEQNSAIPQFHWTAGLAQDVFKSLSGSSFLSSFLLLALVIVGVMTSLLSRELRLLLIWSAAFVVGSVLLADAWKGYFFAARQILFAAPLLVVLAGVGLWQCFEKSRGAATVLLIALCVLFIKSDVSIAATNTENWEAAANALERTSDQGYCLKFAAEHLGGAALYAVYVPGLSSRVCGSLQEESKVAVVWHRYLSPADVSVAEDQVRAAGFRPVQHLTIGGTTIQRETR